MFGSICLIIGVNYQLMYSVVATLLVGTPFESQLGYRLFLFSICPILHTVP